MSNFNEKFSDSLLLEESIKIEDEIEYLFGLGRAELTKVIIELGMENDF